MKISVANPIYDSVFKFLMDDERIAKTVLSALLKKEVLSVEMRKHEHPNITRDKLSMFRIDFAARVRENDGSTQLILIELQKTWLDTETLRFRRYLAAQYNAEENIQKQGENQGYALPMVAVYLLGHRVGDIDKPVVYVGHKALDYDGKEVENGENDPFISSLIHDSIIVQIPLLHGKINNRLDKVLSVFDKSQRTEESQQIINLAENLYKHDPEMMQIIHRLSLATMSAEVRQEMNDEDEFFAVIEARDTQVMKQKKIISEQQDKITEQQGKITEQLGKITEQQGKITEQRGKITEQQDRITEQQDRITEQQDRITEQNAQIKAMAQAMLKNGVSIDIIAQTINKSIEEVKAML